ncbi:hypothetical protein [Trinickia fusca]|uniref:Uncharacterized protein n=1 Tax=Trinickia fusca TaxID=2419777 RepID=A0A494XD71_9BURK|nr:hypothetical protein [Trinickia fusca]RKP45543.1 hypothetical protein D7S89_19540 [Trinickia fusca]
MEKWIVIGGIWTMTVLCLTFFVRGASPAHSRAVSMARARNARLAAEAEGRAKDAGAAEHA